MESRGVPDAPGAAPAGSLRAGVARITARQMALDVPFDGVAAGDVVVVAGGGVRRVVVVTGVAVAGPGDGWCGCGVRCSVMLACSTPEMACDLDVVVSGVTPYPLVVQAELYAQVCVCQVAGRAGSVDAETVAALRGALASDGESLERFSPRPLPLGGRDDPRRRFKEQELDDVAALRRRCASGDSWDPAW